MAQIINFPSPKYTRKMAIIEANAIVMIHIKSLHEVEFHSLIEEAFKNVCEIMINDGSPYTREMLLELISNTDYINYIESQFMDLFQR